MLYLYNVEAGAVQLTLEGDAHRYIYKVRRHKAEDILSLRNLRDGILYHYSVESIDKRVTVLTLKNSQRHLVSASKTLHIGWCVIDPKNIEKVLPTLNEMGVEKITFFYCKRSQNSFKIDFKRLEKILINSSQQSGRSTLMILEMGTKLETFVQQYPQSKMLNFSTHNFVSQNVFDTIVIGCEGGFHEDEVALFSEKNIVGLDTPLVLKSESAVCSVAAKMLL